MSQPWCPVGRRRPGRRVRRLQPPRRPRTPTSSSSTSPWVEAYIAAAARWQRSCSPSPPTCTPHPLVAEGIEHPDEPATLVDIASVVDAPDPAPGPNRFLQVPGSDSCHPPSPALQHRLLRHLTVGHGCTSRNAHSSPSERSPASRTASSAPRAPPAAATFRQAGGPKDRAADKWTAGPGQVSGRA